MNTWLNTFNQWILEKNLISPHESILLSLSAGKDSMFMLDLLLKVQDQYNLKLGIFHMDHGLREDESTDDRNFIEEKAENCNIPFFLCHYDISSKKKGISFEEDARNKRYSILNETAQANDFRKIATAHNKDDSIETVLMRIFSGTGLKGLQGIPYVRDNIIRPILCFTVEEIYSYLQTFHVTWREDSSNKSSDYNRNFIRNEIIPLVNTRFPVMTKSVENLQVIAREALELINESVLSKENIIRSEKSIEIHVTDINSEKKLKHILASEIPDFFHRHISGKIIDEIIRKMSVSKKNITMYSLSEGSIDWNFKNKIIELNKDIVTKKKINPYFYTFNFNESNDSKIYIPEIKGSISLFKSDFNTYLQFKNDNNYIFVTYIHNSVTLNIRNKRIGDRIKLSFGSKKIKDIFIEKKLDNEKRNCVPFLIINNDIVAVMTGFIDNNIPNRISNTYQVTTPDDSIIALKYENNNPDI